MRINMGGLGKAVRNAGISGRRETTKSMRKTPSIGRDIEEWEVHEAQIPGTQIEPQRPFLDTLGNDSLFSRFWFESLAISSKAGH
jgi:hypothetical protein